MTQPLKLRLDLPLVLPGVAGFLIFTSLRPLVELFLNR